MAQLGPDTIIGGEFRIVRPLASGGMGAVYIAEQASTRQLRALKLMHEMLVDNPRSRERFELEAHAASRIASEHVVGVIAAGVDAALGVPWIAMELLEGEDLAARIARSGAVPPGEARTILRQLCHALAAAHASGVVHRDVKPENVFLARVHSSDLPFSVKVLDFGIARLAADASQSVTGAVGTPLWMAPEQSSSNAAIGPQADVWALGLIAFQVLTGRHYWRAANSPAPSLQVLLRETVLEPLDAPSVRAAELGVAQLLPPGFDAWFSRAVSREPSARFPTAREAFDALDPLLAPFDSGVAAPGASLTAHTTPGPGRPPYASSPTLPATTASASTFTATQAPKPKSSMLPLVLGGLFVLVLGGGALAAGGYYFFVVRAGSSTTASVAAPGSATSTTAGDSTSAPSPAAGGSATAADSSRSQTQARTGTTPNVKGTPTSTATTTDKPAATAAVADTPTPAPTTAAAAPPKTGAGTGPFDQGAADAATNKSAAQAASACKAQKTSPTESYHGTISFRGNGTVHGSSIVGDGGARSCVLGIMSATRSPPYDDNKYFTAISAYQVTVK